MPPPESHLTLSAADKALLERWVVEGADYRPHWSLVPVHTVGVPRLRDGTRRPNPIDAFVRTRLERRRPHAGAAGLARDRHPPSRVQPDRPAAVARRHRRLPGRSIAWRLRPRRRALPGVSGVRRADGDGLARPRAIRRHVRLSGRRRPRHVGLSRLGHPRVQRQPVVRSVPHLAARRRSPAEPHARAADRHGLQSIAPADERGRQHRRRVPHRVRRRSREHVRHRDARPHDGVRPLPRPQVRRDHAARLLFDVRLLQQHRRVRPLLALHERHAVPLAAALAARRRSGSTSW